MNWQVILKTLIGIGWIAIPGSVAITIIYFAVRKQQWFKQLTNKAQSLITQ